MGQSIWLLYKKKEKVVGAPLELTTQTTVILLRDKEGKSEILLISFRLVVVIDSVYIRTVVTKPCVQ
jgi:hypothetical protein